MALSTIKKAGVERPKRDTPERKSGNNLLHLRPRYQARRRGNPRLLHHAKRDDCLHIPGLHGGCEEEAVVEALQRIGSTAGGREVG